MDVVEKSFSSRLMNDRARSQAAPSGVSWPLGRPPAPLLVLVWSSAFQQHRTTVGEICKQQELSAMAKNGTVTFSRTGASFLGETQPAYSNPRCPPTSYGQSQCLIKALIGN